MDQQLASQMTEQILAEAASRYNITLEDIRPIRGIESFIYEYETEAGGRILRLSHSARRPYALVAGEVDFIQYLAERGVSAAQAVESAHGRLVEVIELPDGAHFSAVSFVKAPGHPPKQADWTPELHWKMGQLLGRMHALAKDYVPTDAAFRRPVWNEEVEGIAEKYLPAEDQDVAAKWSELLDQLKALPTPNDVYGLVHIDFHPGNFFVDNGRITLFDFDDCQYAWHANDIAMALFYAVPHHCESEEDLRKARAFFNSFMEGYRTENQIGSEWLAHIPLFLKYREMDLYINLHKHFAGRPLDEWGESFMRGRKQKILQDVPYVNLAF